MDFDLEKPRWPAEVASEVAGVGRGNPSIVRVWRHKDGLRLGKYMGGRAGGWLFSAIDVGELAIVCALRAVGVPPAEAITRARAERRKLKNMLLCRLQFGYWGLGIVVVPADPSRPVPLARGFSLGEIAERIIDGLKLPYPIIAETPRAAEEVAIITKIVTLYVESPEFQRRVDRFREEVVGRRKPTNWAEASQKLGVPLWIITSGLKGIAEETAEAAHSERVPISIANVLRDRLGVEIVEAAP